MKLEIGKRYLTKEGRIVLITDFDPSNTVPYKGFYSDGGSDRWHEDGLNSYRLGRWCDIVKAIEV